VAMPAELVNSAAWNCDLDTAIMMQGAIYGYSDGSSCTVASGQNICTTGKCCLSGTTVVDSTFAKWGCGIGIELDDSGGNNPVKSVYTGPVSCFMVTLTGSSGGNVVRIGFTQSATPASGAVSPYTEIPAFTNGWMGKVCFADVSCPSWSTSATCSKTGTNGTPVDMQIQISAGSTTSTVGAYNVCLSSLQPITSSGTGGSGGGGSSGTSSCPNPAGMGTLNAQFDAQHVMCGSKDYIVQNNDWGVSAPGSQTISYGPGTKLKVATQGGTGQNGSPASFPSIFIGSNSNHTTTGSNLPLATSSIGTSGIQTSWTWSDSGVPSGSSYNAAYDVWFSSGTGGDPATASAPSGGYLMVWFYKPSDNQPIGALVPNGSVTIGGQQFNVWYGTNSGNNKPVVSYVAMSKMMTWSFSLGAFINDALTRTCTGSTKCLAPGGALTNVFAGFEIWKGGVGLQTTDFGVTVP
jgi:hypothetical protein